MKMIIPKKLLILVLSIFVVFSLFLVAFKSHSEFTKQTNKLEFYSKYQKYEVVGIKGLNVEGIITRLLCASGSCLYVVRFKQGNTEILKLDELEKVNK